MFFGTELKVSTRFTPEQTCGKPWKTAEMSQTGAVCDRGALPVSNRGQEDLAAGGTEDQIHLFLLLPSSRFWLPQCERSECRRLV